MSADIFDSPELCVGKFINSPFSAVTGEIYCSYLGKIAGQKYGVFETFGDVDASLVIAIGDKIFAFNKFQNPINSKAADYCGLPLQKVYDSGKDLLAEELYKKGISLESMKGVLPSSYSDGYISLGYYTSPRTFTVDSNGNIFFQPDFSVNRPKEPTFKPSELGADMSTKPTLSFANGTVPVLFGLFGVGDEKTELMYCVGQGDCDFEYGIWVRCTKVQNGVPTSTEYKNIGSCNICKRLPIATDVFYECIAGIFMHYIDNTEKQSKLSLPEKELEQVFTSSLATAEGLLNGFKTKYGNMFYSLESHDNFPPNYIMAISTFAMCGETKKARLITEHFLNNCVDSFGRIIYRQGDSQFYGYSGSEVGQLIWVMRRAFGLGKTTVCAQYSDVLCKMADNLISYIAENDTYKGVYLIHMCAEADTNGRIYDYLQNTMWAVRGLDALAEILVAAGKDANKYIDAAALLCDSLKKVYKETETQTKYGTLVPFQLQYAALPLTLSRCKDTAFEVSKEAFDAYMAGDTNPRNDISGSQNLLENSYANYRYYPEMLSSFMLDEKYADAIDCLRSELGGEMLAMTRIFGGIDDWPAYNNALFLLESGRIEKYRMLMYAHILYHGLPDFGLYYEQACVLYDGSMKRNADSCLPSTLLPAFMITSSFVHLSTDCKKLMLCKGVPAEWFKKGFKVENVCCAGGTVSLECKEGTLKITLSDELDGYEKLLYTDGKEPVRFSECIFCASV